jgi:hypothetical protein
MRALSITVAVLATLSTAGCLKKSAFNCADDTACGTGGVCEPDTGFCSVSSAGCDSGRVYSDTAGNGLAGQCVGGGTPNDGPNDPDGTPNDGTPPDVPTGPRCDGYADLAGATAGHKYLFLTTPRNYSNSHNLGCLAVAGAYLAIPNDPGELAAYETLTAGADAWVGFDDITTEDSFQDIFNNPFNPATPGITIVDNKMQEDCALMISGTSVDISSCNTNAPAVCECEP